MKAIINGRKYDTDTAKKIASYWNGHSCRDFCNVTEELYIKRTGEYFLYGYGGPMSKYAHAVGDNSWSGGEKITPLTEAEARVWAETHIDVDEYEEIFGEVEE